MTLDLKKPIQTIEGWEAKYMGQLPNGYYAVSWKHRGVSWAVQPFSDRALEKRFRNVSEDAASTNEPTKEQQEELGYKSTQIRLDAVVNRLDRLDGEQTTLFGMIEKLTNLCGKLLQMQEDTDEHMEEHCAAIAEHADALDALESGLAKQGGRLEFLKVRLHSMEDSLLDLNRAEA